jgi:hypothetical protein
MRERAVAVPPELEGAMNPSGITPEASALWVPQQIFEQLSEVFVNGDESHPPGAFRPAL